MCQKKENKNKLKGGKNIFKERRRSFCVSLEENFPWLQGNKKLFILSFHTRTVESFDF